jgi:hypothetical protein
MEVGCSYLSPMELIVAHRQQFSNLFLSTLVWQAEKYTAASIPMNSLVHCSPHKRVNPVHNKYKACRSKCKHTRSKYTAACMLIFNSLVKCSGFIINIEKILINSLTRQKVQIEDAEAIKYALIELCSSIPMTAFVALCKV